METRRMDQKRKVEKVKEFIWELKRRAVNGDEDAYRDLLTLSGYIDECCKMMREVERRSR